MHVLPRIGFVRFSNWMLSIALLAVAGPAHAATIENWPATSFAGGWGEPVPFVSPTAIPYMGQTFTAPDGTLDSLRIVLEGDTVQVGNQGDTIFHVLITEIVGSAGGQNFHPTTSCGASSDVCFESGNLVMPFVSAQQEFLIPLGGLALNAGQTYFFLLDAWVTADGIGSQIGVGTRASPGIDGIARSRGVTGQTTESRDQHFASAWNNTVTGDIAYILSYTPTPVPEPGSGALAAAGLAALGWLRRRSARQALS